MNYLQNWIFTYNPYIKQWCGAEREHIKDLFNNFDSKNVLRSSKIETLEALIVKNKGNINKIKTSI